MVNAGADVNKKKENDITAVFDAAEYGFLEVVQILVEHGADFLTPSPDKDRQHGNASGRGSSVSLFHPHSFGCPACSIGAGCGP